jgi:uncharacterized protein (TIGR00290 family)
MPAPGRPRALLSWSSGKDAAWALHVTRAHAELDVVGLLTTVTERFDRVAMHGVRRELLRAQAESVALPLHEVVLPWPCPNGAYEAAMAAALAAARDRGVEQVVFGDLFLADVRAYRDALLVQAGLRGSYPLWGRDTGELAAQMVSAGLEAVLVCVDPQRLGPSFAGRTFDAALLASLPPGVDPCGEFGEFHTCVIAGPPLRAPLAVRVGNQVAREGFVFCDLQLARAQGGEAAGGAQVPAPGEREGPGSPAA